MIIVEITGGIGNQLFQYSSAKALAIKRNDLLFLYPNYKNDKKRIYRLNVFNIDEKIISEKDLKNFLAPLRKNIFFKIIQKIKPYYKKRIFIDKIWEPDLKLFKSAKNVFLKGYWANYRYFENIRDILLKKISLKKNYESEIFLRYKNKIENDPFAVSIHIRRGDYAESDFFGILPMSYYKNSINFLKNRLKSLSLYVFSDDIDFVIKNYNFSGKVTFIKDSLQDYHELMLMSFCKHNIIANSSFSWWGAWLNKNPNKIVIAPKKWYSNPKAQNFYENYSFIPNNWIKL